MKMHTMTIERILPSIQMSETEYFNAKREMQGRQPIHENVTKARPGLQLTCGQRCFVRVTDPNGIILEHGPQCQHRPNDSQFIQAAANGQAVVSLRNRDGSKIHGILTLNGLFPHEETA